MKWIESIPESVWVEDKDEVIDYTVALPNGNALSVEVHDDYWRVGLTTLYEHGERIDIDGYSTNFDGFGEIRQRCEAAIKMLQQFYGDFYAND